MLFSLSRSGYAPARLGELSASGSPHVGLSLSAFGVLVAIVVQEYAPESAYLYIVGASLFGGMLAWWITLLAHISFRQKARNEDLDKLPLRVPGGKWLSIIGFVALTICVLSTAWVPATRITVISGPIYLLLLTIAYLAVRRRVHHSKAAAQL
jgi:L-asparagine transporter-like permease